MSYIRGKLRVWSTFWCPCFPKLLLFLSCYGGWNIPVLHRGKYHALVYTLLATYTVIVKRFLFIQIMDNLCMSGYPTPTCSQRAPSEKRGVGPQCDEDGNYERIQYSGVIVAQYQWCIDTSTGEEIEGTKVGRDEDVLCPAG